MRYLVCDLFQWRWNNLTHVTPNFLFDFDLVFTLKVRFVDKIILPDSFACYFPVMFSLLSDQESTNWRYPFYYNTRYFHTIDGGLTSLRICLSCWFDWGELIVLWDKPINVYLNRFMTCIVRIKSLPGDWSFIQVCVRVCMYAVAGGNKGLAEKVELLPGGRSVMHSAVSHRGVCNCVHMHMCSYTCVCAAGCCVISDTYSFDQ